MLLPFVIRAPSQHLLHLSPARSERCSIGVHCCPFLLPVLQLVLCLHMLLVLLLIPTLLPRCGPQLQHAHNCLCVLRTQTLQVL
jgi:hypothetical protein